MRLLSYAFGILIQQKKYCVELAESQNHKLVKRRNAAIPHYAMNWTKSGGGGIKAYELRCFVLVVQ